MKDGIDKQNHISSHSVKGTSRIITAISTGFRLSPGHDNLLALSVIGGLVGMLVGTLPAALWVLLFNFSFTPLYTFMPLLIYAGIQLFKGYVEKRGFILIGIFSVIGIYLTFLSCQASEYIIKYKMLFLNLPLVTATLVGKSDALYHPVFSSAYIYAVLFTALGVFLSYELLLHKNSDTENQNPITHQSK